MNTCPLLAKAKIDRPTCDFPELCNLPTVCFWARFHGLDAETLKPATEHPVQQDLFTTT